MAQRRKYGNDDDDVSRKRRRGEGGDADFRDEADEVHLRLQDIIARVGNKNGSASLESNLESLVSTLENDLGKYRTDVIEIISKCVANMPDKVTIYTTLVGLLNAKNFNFGGEIVERLMSDLQEKLNEENYKEAMYIMLFLCDLGNARVLTISSVVEFLESLVQAAYEENSPQPRTDWFVFVVVHALPYVAKELAEKKKEELDNLLEGLEKYMQSRSTTHLPLIQVWHSHTPHQQEEYLECIWAQVCSLREAEWKENHIERLYNAFETVLHDALQHNLPSFSPPAHKESNVYPCAWVVFRLFDKADCPDDGTTLPESHSIDRFLIEEELFWIIDQYNLDRKACAEKLMEYGKTMTVPVVYMALEVIFAQMFRLPASPHPQSFYAALLLELCKPHAHSEQVPEALALAADHLYQRVEGMQPVCVDRLVDWFSFHLSNMSYRWCWDDWKDCLKVDAQHPKSLFVREVLEKCMRLSYYDRVGDFVPDKFAVLLPSRPEIRFMLDDETEPLYERSQQIGRLFMERADDQRMMEEMKIDNTDSYDSEAFYVFLTVMLKMACKSFSHNFSALSRYSRTLKTIADSAEEMQRVVLTALYGAWKTNHQMMIILIDKLLKMQVLDCGNVVAWLFSDEMRHERERQWVWEVLNSALEKLSRHIQKVEKEVKSLEEKKKEEPKEGEDTVMEDSEELTEQRFKLDSLKDFQKNLFLDVLHKCTILLTEQIEEAEKEGGDYRTPWFLWIQGRFKQVFLTHFHELWSFSEELGRELFPADTTEPVVMEVYQQFIALMS